MRRKIIKYILLNEYTKLLSTEHIKIPLLYAKRFEIVLKNIVVNFYYLNSSNILK